MQTVRRLHVLADIAVLFVLGVHVLGLLGLGGTGEANAGPHGSRVCFASSSWDAPQGLRPCARILRVQEDGSFSYAVEDANGTVRYSASVGALDR